MTHPDARPAADADAVEAALEGLGRELAVALRERFSIGYQTFRFLKTFEHKQSCSPPERAPRRRFESLFLLRVQLDDEPLVNLNLDEVFALGQTGDTAAQGLAIHFQPVGHRQVRRRGARG